MGLGGEEADWVKRQIGLRGEYNWIRFWDIIHPEEHKQASMEKKKENGSGPNGFGSVTPKPKAYFYRSGWAGRVGSGQILTCILRSEDLRLRELGAMSVFFPPFSIIGFQFLLNIYLNSTMWISW